MKRSLLSATVFFLSAHLAIGQVTTGEIKEKPTSLQSTSQSSAIPTKQTVKVNAVSSSSEPTAVTSKVTADMMISGPFKQTTKLQTTGDAPATVSSAAPANAPGQGDANMFRARFSRFLVAEELPADFPQWDVATQTKEEFRATVFTWVAANKSKVKPEYHSHRVFSGK